MPVCYLEIRRASNNDEGNIVVNGENNIYPYFKPIAEIIADLKQKYPFLSGSDLKFIKEMF